MAALYLGVVEASMGIVEVSMAAVCIEVVEANHGSNEIFLGSSGSLEEWMLSASNASMVKFRRFHGRLHYLFHVRLNCFQASVHHFHGRITFRPLNWWRYWKLQEVEAYSFHGSRWKLPRTYI